MSRITKPENGATDNQGRAEHRRGTNQAVIAQEISMQANTTYAKAYAFTNWVMANKWPELTKTIE